MNLRGRLARLAALFRRARFERELDDEVAAHLELAEHDALARGLSAQEARLDALRRFGGVASIQEQHRDARSARWVENLTKDVQYGSAALWREPLFAAVAIGVLALGIGANVAVFSVVDAVLIRPLPFPAPEHIVRWWEAPTDTTTNSTTALNFVAMSRLTKAFAAQSAEASTSATITVNGEPIRLHGRLVSAEHFAVFGVHPMLGRGFRPDEDRAGSAAVIVLSHAAWHSVFGGDAAILGRRVLLDDVPHEVIGIMPPGAFDRDKARPRESAASFWKPQAFTEQQLAAGSHWLNPVARLAPGVTIEEARRDLLRTRAAIDDIVPAWKKNWSVIVEPYDVRLVDDRLRQALYVAIGAVLLVLVTACANLTNLLLARGLSRQKELAVRNALGAGRSRLVAQMVSETMLLGVAGGIAGAALAYALIQVAVPLLPVTMPYTADVALNVRVLLFAFAVALIVSLAVGIVPALRLSRTSVVSALNSSSRGSSTANDGLRRTIVAATVAASLILVCGSVLLFKSLERLAEVDIGVDTSSVITASIDIARDRYPTAAAASAFYERLTTRLAVIPRIERVALSGDLPLEGTGGENLRLPGRDTERLNVRFKRAGPGYFETMGIALQSGRFFVGDDRQGGELVTIINEALVEDIARTFGVHDPLGQLVDLPAIGFGTPTVRQRMRVVGIVGNERVRPDLRGAIEGIAYVPLAQAPITWLKLSARVQGAPTDVVPALREALREVDARVALADVQSLADIKARSLSGLREPAWLVALFALLSTLLAVLGLYGVVSHAVSQRQREIGVRLALGARAGSVLALVLRSVLLTLCGGIAAGLAGSLIAARVARSLLFEVSTFDATAFVGAAIFLLLVGMAAAAVPARRASRTDPTISLRSDY